MEAKNENFIIFNLVYCRSNIRSFYSCMLYRRCFKDNIVLRRVVNINNRDVNYSYIFYGSEEIMKLLEHKLGNLKGTLYEYNNAYKFKIKLGDDIVAQQYTWMYNQLDCYDKMVETMQNLSMQQSML